MNNDRLREELRNEPIPGEQLAEDRAWGVVHAAFDERTQTARPHRSRTGLAVAVAAAGLVLLALSPAGASVRDWVSDVVEAGREPSDPALTSLPTGGRLLVESQRGPWIVHAGGSKRLLGSYDQAAWSPRGLFVAATSGHELVAVDPLGDLRWALAQRGSVSDPAWAPSGFRIAYLSGDALRVVAGDGRGDRTLDARVARTPPAWKPAARHLLSYVDVSGRVSLLDVDSGGMLWTSSRFTTRIESLEWSRDGRRLLVLTDSLLTVLDGDGERIIEVPTGGRAESASFSPQGSRIALARLSDNGTKASRSELVLLAGQGDEIGRGLKRRPLFTGPGLFTGVTWSPDGQWLLLSWRDADQWLFLRPSDERVVAVSNISRQFDPGGAPPAPFPRVSGWCCAP